MREQIILCWFANERNEFSLVKYFTGFFFHLLPSPSRAQKAFLHHLRRNNEIKRFPIAKLREKIYDFFFAIVFIAGFAHRIKLIIDHYAIVQSLLRIGGKSIITFHPKQHRQTSPCPDNNGKLLSSRRTCWRRRKMRNSSAVRFKAVNGSSF